MEIKYRIIILCLLVIIMCLIVNENWQEGFTIEEQIIDVDSNGKPIDSNGNPKPILDKYQNEITSNYYLVSYGTDKWPSGKYKKYTVKAIPYGYKLVDSADPFSGITPATNTADFSGRASAGVADLPDYRELYYSEYSKFPAKTNWKGTFEPPPEYFNVKPAVPEKKDKSNNIIYDIAKIPPNHALLDSPNNPKFTYLKYTGEYQDIPGYTYSDINTGEFEPNSNTTIQAPPTGYYKIKLVKSYNADNTPKLVRYVVAKLPTGMKVDPKDPTFTKLTNDMEYNPDASVAVGGAAVGTGPSDSNNGVHYQYDANGKLVEVQYQENAFAPVLYYIPGAYKFGASNFVPNYEDSVYLSRLTRESQLAPVVNTASQLGGFCAANKASPQTIEEKCGALDLNACASTSCCVLLGGQKCVAGSANGPHFVANYTDYALKNKDFYYYQGKCYGNC